jgi:aerobic-type carbon monoxide dehydrogenase small subunit (CoxS/CutS family)
MSEEKKIGITRRQFLRDAGIVVGSTAVGSVFLLSACDKGEEVTKTVTTTAPGATNTVTTTAPGATVTAPGSTQTVTKYTCPVCSKEFDSLSALKAHFDAEHLGWSESASNLLVITVNGDTYGAIIEPQWTLMKVLREQFGFIGVKRGCEEGACGVCTVLLNGRPTLSCLTLAAECQGSEVETIEGLNDGENYHPIQKAFMENFGFECGYCTPGQILSTKALLAKNSNPTKEEIRKALSGNICKCGGYPQIVKSVEAAAGK